MQVALDSLSDVLHNCTNFGRLVTLCSAKDTYLVGGAIRDALIGRSITDLDLISASDLTLIAKDFARQIGGHWFWLDKERLQSRVVVNRDADSLHYDFAPFRAPELERDLLDRDFTINAMALSLTGDLSIESLVDPCYGLKDLQQSSLRMVGKDSFSNDPLRIIKGIRHATILGLDIEAATLQSMQREMKGIDHVASERIRQEIWKTLANEQAGRGLQFLQECGAGQKLFGSDFDSHVEKLKMQLERCRVVWHQLAQNHPVINNWLMIEVEQGLSNEMLLLWTFLLTLIDPELPARLAEKWCLSRKAKAKISAIVGLDQAVLNEFATIARNERAFTLWAESYRVEPKLLLLSMAVLCTPDDTLTSETVRAWVPAIACFGDKRLNDLVDGNWLRNELGLKDGPDMTRALKLLRNAEIFGQVSNHEEARQFLAQSFRNRD